MRRPAVYDKPVSWRRPLRDSLLIVALQWCRPITAAYVVALLCGTDAFGKAADPITDEDLRCAAIRAVFSGMSAPVRTAVKTGDSSPKRRQAVDIRFPDAMAEESVYVITGVAANEVEQCASENLLTDRFSQQRQVRMKLFHWPSAKHLSKLLAVLQYSFTGANPAMSCPSIGLLVQLADTDGTWKVRKKYLLETTHHSSLQRIQMVDFVGGDDGHLLIESDFGGAGSVGSTLQVFDLCKGEFDEVLSLCSRLEYEDQEA